MTGHRVNRPGSFSLLLSAIAIMNLGYSITNVAFPILLVQRYGVGGELARTLMLRLLPMMIAGGTSAWLLRHADARIVAGVSMVLGGVHRAHSLHPVPCSAEHAFPPGWLSHDLRLPRTVRPPIRGHRQ